MFKPKNPFCISSSEAHLQPQTFEPGGGKHLCDERLAEPMSKNIMDAQINGAIKQLKHLGYEYKEDEKIPDFINAMPRYRTIDETLDFLGYVNNLLAEEKQKVYDESDKPNKPHESVVNPKSTEKTNEAGDADSGSNDSPES